jgi:serine/threonine protein kinase
MIRSRINIRPDESGGTSRWGSLSSARLFLRKQLWIWPLLAAAMLFVVGYWLRSSVNRSLSESLEGQLQVVLQADVAALTEWFSLQEATASAAARDNDVLDAIGKMVAFAKDEKSALVLANSAQLEAVKEALAPWIEVGHYNDYLLIDTASQIVASSRDELLGRSTPEEYSTIMKRVLAGESVVTRPFRSIVMLRDAKGQERAGLPTMFVCAPVRGDDGNSIIAVLTFRLHPEDEFTSVLQLARFGKSGETYAIDKTGVMLSQSRFDDELKKIGLLTDMEDAVSTLTVEVRDPGIDLTIGNRPTANRKDQPLTYPAQQAINGTSGVSVEGHRDYRGREQIGAWTWLDKYGMGIITEVDYEEAMAPGGMVDIAFWTMFGLLTALSLAILGFSLIVARLQQRMQKEAMKQQKLGQYHLEEKLGEGGMGVVYRGRHALMRRPTAIKLLDINKVTEASTARFEREVQLTSQLNHPNTIAIYDYGRTPEGIFYYAMEYLDGMDLERLVNRFGPMPEGRVVNILLQVCGSLSEAHVLGMVHRDIKPANVMLCRRGGLVDFVKVLDFGLVKALDSERLKTLTAADSITGTPMFISPEGIERPQDVDPRSDLYAVGAVGYFILTGHQPFEAVNIVELCMKVVGTPPQSPAERLGRPIAGGLDAVLMKCLAKSPEDRFGSINELADALRGCAASLDWSDADAAAWWNKNTDRPFGTSSAPTPKADNATRTLVWTNEEKS